MMSASTGSPGAPGAPKSMASRVMQWLGRLGGSLTRVALGLVGLAFLTGAGALVFVSQTVVGRQAVADLVEGALEGAVNGEVVWSRKVCSSMSFHTVRTSVPAER